MKTGTSILRRSIALSVVLAVLLMVFFTGSTSSSATTYEDLQRALKQAQADRIRIEKELGQIATQKKQLEQQNKKLQGSLAWLNSRSSEEKSKYTALLGDLEAAFQEMTTAIQMFTESQENLKDKQAQYKTRLRVMFEKRQRNTLEILLESKDAAGFLANLEVIAAVAEHDTQILMNLETAKEDAELKQRETEARSKEMQAVVDAKKAEIDALKKNMALTAAQLKNTKDALAAIERKENQLLEESKKMESSIKSLQQKIAYYGGRMVWPYPQDRKVYSPFGMRYHPILHTYRMHTGVDLGGRYGAPIVATGRGKVIVVTKIANYNATTGNNTGGSNYGNYIVIDHGGGVSTLYAHLKLIKVRLGQNVNPGDLIGLCGSTGLSTGPHLHFEVRLNGSPVNPMQDKYLGKR